MPFTWVKCLVVALITSVLSLVVLLAGVQPSSRLSFGPTVAPLGPQLLSRITPEFLDESKAPSTKFPGVTVSGSITINPPSQVAVPKPPGIPRIGTDAYKRLVLVSQAGCSIPGVSVKRAALMVIWESSRTELWL